MGTTRKRDETTTAGLYLLSSYCKEEKEEDREGGNKRSNSQYTYYTATYTAKPTGEKERKNSSYSVWCVFLLPELQPHFDLLVAFTLLLSYVSFFFLSAVVRIGL